MAVIDLQSKRKEREQHCAGLARCLDCRHEWTAVAPSGVTWLECPACSLMRGHFVGLCERAGEHWHCSCGNNLFHVVVEGVYCPNCGEWQQGF